MSTKTVSEIIRALEARAPSSTAEEWDNVGLLVGDPRWRTAGAVVAIDLTPEAIAAARKAKFRLIVIHHPCIFPRSRGLSRIVPEPGMSSLIFEALQQGIAVAAYHTNFDQCAMEVVEAVADGLGVEPKGRLLDNASGSLEKLVVFVPQSHVDRVRGAICEAGAGHIGNYDWCTFTASGEGTFRGNPQTSPFIGKPGVLEKTGELRLETVFPKGLRSQVVRALLGAHPYEEVAYDVMAVEQPPGASGLVRGLGYGFWGEFSSAKPFSDVAKSVKRLFHIDGYLLTSPPPSRVRRIAFVAGKGSSFLRAASAMECDIFITGEAGYHVALDGARRGMAVMELGHPQSERFFMKTIERWLSELGLRSASLETVTQKICVGGKK